MIPSPEVHEHKVSPDDDFVLMASDGIFDCLSNEEIVKTVFDILHHYEMIGGLVAPDPEQGVEMLLDEIVQSVMKKSLIHKSEDNVTIILLCFKAFVAQVRRAVKQPVGPF